jgi:hypothetical protein
MTPYAVSSSPSTVELWSMARLPFEPRGWLRDARDQLREALRALHPGGDRVVDAIYVSDDADFFDVENILLYNIGAGAFQHLARNGLRFRRQQGPVPPRPDGAAASHYHRYSIVEQVEDDGDCDVLARFRFQLPVLSSETKPHTVWWALKSGEVDIVRKDQHDGAFGLHVELGVAKEARLNLASIIKPLFDGIICGLQADDGSVDPEAVVRLATLLHVGREEVVPALCDAGRAVIAGGNLVARYRNGVKWNPADDRCTHGALICGERRPLSVVGYAFART